MNKDKLNNLQTKQAPHDLSPADGGEGFVGSNTGKPVGFDYVDGKKGSVTSRPIWSEQSSGADQDTGAPAVSFGGQDSTDEKAPYKKVQTDEGLPQTFRSSAGAGDAGPAGSDSGETMTGQSDLHGQPDTQSVPSADDGEHELDMPQTQFTSNDGGGAPLFKRSR